MKIVKIISGGQTGADMGALEAAIWCKVPHGGWCPKGRICEDGIIPPKYHLQEMNSPNYAKRTEANVVDSDATLLFTFGAPTGGSRLTAALAKKHKRPFFHIDLTQHNRHFVRKLGEEFFGTGKLPSMVPENCVLNVAGSRETNFPGIADQVMRWMIEIIGHVNSTVFYPPGGTEDISRHIIRERRSES